MICLIDILLKVTFLVYGEKLIVLKTSNVLILVLS